VITNLLRVMKTRTRLKTTGKHVKHKSPFVPETILENWVGRTREDSKELPNKPKTAHIARMRGGIIRSTSSTPF